MADSEHIEARTRVRAYLKWKALEQTDPALSVDGRVAVLQALCADGPAALGDFVDSMAAHTVQMLGVICGDDQQAVTDTIAGLIVSETQL